MKTIKFYFQLNHISWNIDQTSHLNTIFIRFESYYYTIITQLFYVRYNLTSWTKIIYLIE